MVTLGWSCMQYLITIKKRTKRKKTVHYWIDGNTSCRMWSTRGLKRSNYVLIQEKPEGMKVCKMCKGNLGKGMREEMISWIDPA